MKQKLNAIIFFMLIIFTVNSFAAPVVVYVRDVQEERRSTRWTLTEWLRIKERMRMMDVWLAMFSSPKKDKFRPELNLVYGKTRGVYTIYNSNGGIAGDNSGTQLKGQIWLTNIVTATTRLRTVNIDFGIEGYQYSTMDIEDKVMINNSFTSSGRTPRSSYWSADLRLFGKHIQDSSLIIKYGKYETKDHLLVANPSLSPHGVMAGAELSLYLFRWLGMEGNYISYGDTSSPQSSKVDGDYYDYMAFIEISLLRIMFGVYREEWELEESGGSTNKLLDVGTYTGVKLQF